jgi:hypothetical protein
MKRYVPYVASLLALAALGVTFYTHRQLQRNREMIQAQQELYETFLLPDFGHPVQDDYFDRRDEAWKKRIAGNDEGRLSIIMFNLSSAKVDDLANPEICVRQAQVAEEMTRANPERTKGGWNRAEFHYAQAIQWWRAHPHHDHPVVQARIQRLTTFFENAARQQGKEPDLEKAIEDQKNFFKKVPAPKGGGPEV